MSSKGKWGVFRTSLNLPACSSFDTRRAVVLSMARLSFPMIVLSELSLYERRGELEFLSLRGDSTPWS